MKCIREGCKEQRSGKSKYCKTHKVIARRIMMEYNEARREGREARSPEEIIASLTLVTPEVEASVIPAEETYPTTKLTGKRLWKWVIALAEKRAQQAGHACVPTPMVVQEHFDLLDDNSPVIEEWNAPSGVCGHAWVHFPKAQSAFVRWLLQEEIGHKAWVIGVGYRGCDIHVGVHSVSYEQNYAAAQEYANVLHHYLPNELCAANARED